MSQRPSPNSVRLQPPISAIVLAGGHSSRMGRDKASLDFFGKTMLQHQIDKFYKCGINDIMVSGSQNVVSHGRFVPDIYPGIGPLGGIHACLRSAKNTICILASVDTPLLPIDCLLNSAFILLKNTEYDAALVSHMSFTEPLMGAYRTRLHSVAEQFITAGNLSVRGLLEHINYATVRYNGKKEFLQGCNTPEEYTALLKTAEFNGIHN